LKQQSLTDSIAVKLSDFIIRNNAGSTDAFFVRNHINGSTDAFVVQNHESM
jgi:hypothetical protein